MARTRRFRVPFLATLPLVFGLFLFGERPSYGIPAFARKYRTSCSTCHEAFPRLNAVGEAFRLNGYKFPDDEAYIKEEPVELGDPAYKRVWPRAIWPGTVPWLPPVSLRALSDFTWDIGGTMEARTEFEIPHEVEVLAAGAFGEDLSFFLELEIEEGEIEGEAWLQWEDLLFGENLLNLRAGNLGMQEFGLFTARDHNRVTVNHYLYADWRVPGSQNDFRIRGTKPGVELNGFGRFWRYAVGVVQGAELSQKDLYAQLAFKIGGVGYDGTGREPSEALGAAEFWRDDSLQLSLFAYRGTGVASGDLKDRFYRVGPGALWRFRDLQLGAGYLYGANDRPYGDQSRRSARARSWFVEVIYYLYPWLIPTVRYEALSLDIPAGVPQVGRHQDRARVVAALKAYLRANISCTLEGRFSTRDERFTRDTGELNDDNRITLRLDFAF